VVEPPLRISEPKRALVPYSSALLKSTELKSFKQPEMRQRSLSLTTSCSELKVEPLRKLKKKQRFGKGVRIELRGL
jgi:hypothetical protein